MGRKGKLHALALVLLCVIVAFIGGCQAIGGVDLNKALLSSFDVKSMEGSGTIELNFNLDNSAQLNASQKDELDLIKIFEHTKIKLDHIAQESPEILSVKGALEFGRGTIPFSVYVSPESLAFWPEGASKPLTVPVKDAAAQLENIPSDMKWVADLQEKAKNPEFLKPLYSYLFSKLPNPSDISLKSGSETINGESVFLQHIHSELKAKDLIPLVRTFILNLLQDDKALKEVIAQYYDTLQPAVSSLADNLGGILDEEDETLPPAIKALMKEETTGLELLHTEFKQVLVILLAALESSQQDPDNAPEALLGKDSSLAVDLYVDSSLKLRKSSIDLLLAPSEGLMPGVKSLNVKTSFENWNVNGTVKAEAISTSNAIPFKSITDASQFLDALDRDSVLYKFATEDMHLARKTANFFVLPESELNEYNAGWAAYSAGGVTLVPARSLADHFGLELKWDAGTQTVLLATADKTKTIALKAGSQNAVINGKSVELEQAPVIQNGAFYVPLRAVADAIGAKVVWEPEYRLVEVQLN